MTSEEALKYLDDIAHGRKMDFDPHELKEIVAKDLEVLKILRSYIVGNKDYWFIDIASYDLGKKENNKVKEWLEE